MLRKISRSDQLLPRMVSLYPAAEISICRPLHAIPTMNVSLVDCSAPTRPIYSSVRFASPDRGLELIPATLVAVTQDFLL
jgi:hypothetical protein